MLRVAKAVTFLCNKSVDYFGKEASDSLVALFRVISVLEWFQLRLGVNNPYQAQENFQHFINVECKKNLSYNAYQSLLRIKNRFYDTSPLFALLSQQALEKMAKNSNDVYMEYRKMLYDLYNEFLGGQLMITESSFFNNINFFLPSRAFMPQDSIKLDFESYSKQILNVFRIPNENYTLKFDFTLQDLMQNSLNKEFESYSRDNQALYVLVMPSREKQQGDSEKFLESLATLESKYGENDPYIAFCKARFYAQNLDFESATKQYLIALKHGKDVMGGYIESIIKEGLIMASLNTRSQSVDLKNLKSDFAKFYTQGVLLGLIENRSEEISQYFLNDYQKRFNSTFKYLFVESNETMQKDSTESKPSISILDSKIHTSKM